MIFTIIINSCDHGTNSYAEFQLGLQNRNNTYVQKFLPQNGEWILAEMGIGNHM